MNDEKITENSDSAPNAQQFAAQHRFKFWVLVLLVIYWGALFIGTHIPMPQLGAAPSYSDKILHFLAYAGLAFLLGYYRSISAPLKLKELTIIFGTVCLYGAIDELLQMVPGINRTGDLYDLLADACGALCGLAILLIANTTVLQLQKNS